MPLSLFADWVAPWQNAREPSAPWLSRERQESRENFFKSLAVEASEPETRIISSREVPKTPASEVVSPTSFGGGELQDLPWAAHRDLYPHQKAEQKQKWTWPIEGGRLVSGYGIRQGRFHEGLDIGGAHGSIIRAASGGRIVFAGSLGSYGLVTVIYHGDGLSSIYAHNSQNLRKKGEWVNRGDSIARVGKTGVAEGPHCHFEIRRDGKPINPFHYTFSGSRLVATR